MEQGGEFEHYLTPCQSIPGIFEIPQYDALLLSSELDPYKPEVEEKGKEETKIYCRLVVILITKAHGTGRGV